MYAELKNNQESVVASKIVGELVIYNRGPS